MCVRGKEEGERKGTESKEKEKEERARTHARARASERARDRQVGRRLLDHSLHHPTLLGRSCDNKHQSNASLAGLRGLEIRSYLCRAHHLQRARSTSDASIFCVFMRKHKRRIVCEHKISTSIRAHEPGGQVLPPPCESVWALHLLELAARWCSLGLELVAGR
jgi:hypothetical protein